MTATFRTPDEEQRYREHLALFREGSRDAYVEIGGTRYEWSEQDLEDLAMDARFYMVLGGLNSSVYANVVRTARSRFRPNLARAQIIELCARTMKTTVEDVERSMEWTANYMAFHDGTDPAEEHPYPPTAP